jgi:hypothetical protein
MMNSENDRGVKELQKKGGIWTCYWTVQYILPVKSVCGEGSEWNSDTENNNASLTKKEKKRWSIEEVGERI